MADGGQAEGVSAVSATLLSTCEFVDNRHTAAPEQVLWDIADTIARTGALIFRDTSAGVVFCPEHAQMLADAGFAKGDVQAALMEKTGRTGADLRRAGKNGLRSQARFADPDETADATFTRILPTPRHVPLLVAGARNAAISMVVRIFGEWSGTTIPVEVKHDLSRTSWGARFDASPGRLPYGDRRRGRSRQRDDHRRPAIDLTYPGEDAR